VIVGVGPWWCAIRATVAGVPVEFRPSPFGGLADIPVAPDAPLRAARRDRRRACGKPLVWRRHAGRGRRPAARLRAALQALGMLPGLLARIVEVALTGGAPPMAEMPAALPVRLDWALHAAPVGVMSLLVGAFNLLPSRRWTAAGSSTGL
jgi:hypothetical protein